MIKQLLLGIAIFAAFFIGTAYIVGDNTATGGVGPDSIAYFLDTTAEWIDLNILTRDESKKIELKLTLMQERLDELSDLERLQKMSQKNVEKVKAGYTKLADDVIASLKQKAADAADAQAKALAQKASDVVAKQQESLLQILEKAPTPVKEPLQGVLRITQDAYQRALDIIKNQK
ncbi:MAG: DUF5667 domain-containing protein [Candidatus Azambacteria bacterium]|nr:DUF5667 domain-containing protein [Candidatus Azambacteria bacterium]